MPVSSRTAAHEPFGVWISHQQTPIQGSIVIRTGTLRETQVAAGTIPLIV